MAERRAVVKPPSAGPAPLDEAAPLVRIGEAASRSGVSERTLRYYEEIGLLAPAEYSAGGVRRYGPPELARVQQIRELQELIGLNLDEIRSVVTLEDRIGAIRVAYHQSDSADERRALLVEAIEVTENLHRRVAAKVERIGAFRDDLGARLARYRALLADDLLDAVPAPTS